MQKKQATGVDTWAMMPIYGSIYVIICAIFLPWISLPVLKYSKLPTTYTFWQLETCVDNIQKSIRQGGKLQMPLLSKEELEIVQQVSVGLKIAAAVLILVMVLCAVLAYTKKRKSVGFVRIGFGCAAAVAAAAFCLIAVGNIAINERVGRDSDFINLTIHSYIQMTSWMYAQLIISVVLIVLAKKFLNTGAEYEYQKYIERSQKEDHKIGKRTKMSCILIVIAIPFLIFFGIFFLNDRSSSFIALCIIGLAMVPFAMVFEDRKPQAREVLLISVMAAIAVVGRMAFFMIPQFKPVTAIVIITGVGLGAEAGFLTGAVAGFVSNFFFGQGPWTPWQMFAFGIIGFLAGLLFSKNKKRNSSRMAEQVHKILLCIYGGIATLVIYGLIMDSASIVTMFVAQTFSWKTLMAAYISGFPFNVIHAVSTIIFLFFLTIPMERKLDRIKKKYGILEV